MPGHFGERKAEITAHKFNGDNGAEHVTGQQRNTNAERKNMNL